MLISDAAQTIGCSFPLSASVSSEVLLPSPSQSVHEATPTLQTRTQSGRGMRPLCRDN